MKNMKMLSLAAILAFGIMAFVGTGTASATTFFTDFAHTIAYPTGTTFHESLKTGTSAALTNTSGEPIDTCTESTVHGLLSNETGVTVNENNDGISWGGCDHSTTTVALGSLSINANSEVIGHNSQVTISVFGVSCTYGTGENNTLGTLTSGETPELAINASIPRTAGGFLCPSSGKWVATYIVTAPHALFLSN